MPPGAMENIIDHIIKIEANHMKIMKHIRYIELNKEEAHHNGKHERL